MDDRSLRASWVELDVRDGAQRIVSTSSDRADLGEYVGWYPQGVPDFWLPDDAPGAPPWVTFGPVKDSSAENDDPAATLITVSVLGKSSRRASDGRRIFPRKVFFMPYPRVAELRASYRGLWEALRGVEIPTPDGGPAIIAVPEPSMESLAATVDNYTLARMIAIASVLLEGRIALSDLERLSLEDRLDLLDAAMALLPYGFRSAKSAATAIDNTVTHGLDVVFANIVRGQSKITMSPDSEIPDPVTEEGKRYQELLRDKITHSKQPLRVIDYLWSQRDVPLIADPSYAYARLAQFDLDNTFVRLVRSRKATRRDVIDFFQRTNSDISSIWNQSLDDAERMYAIGKLLTSPDARAESLLRDHWKDIWPDLLNLTSLSMNAGNANQSLWCLKLARSTSIEADDLFLEGLLASNAALPDVRTSRSDALVRVLQDVDISGGTNDYPRTRKRVWSDNDQSWVSDIFRELLVKESADNMSRTFDYADWLCGTDDRMGGAPPPEWIHALRLVHLGRADNAQSPRVSDPIWNALFVRMAHGSGRLPGVLSLIDDDLIRIGIAAFGSSRSDGSPRDLDLEFLRTVLREVNLGRAGVKLNEVARVDAVRTILGAGPLEFPAEGDEQACNLYLDGLGDVFQFDGAGRLRPHLAKKYLEFAAPTRGTGRLAPGAIALLNEWSADPGLKGEVAAHVVSMAGTARPMVEQLSLEYWQCVASRPELRAYAMTPGLIATAREGISAPLIHLHRQVAYGADGAPLGVPNTKLALACYDAYQYGMHPTAMIDALRQAGADQLEPKILDELLREFQGLLFHGKPGGRASEQVLRECYAYIVEGALGESYAASFFAFIDPRLDNAARYLDMTRHDLKVIRARRTGEKPAPGLALAIQSAPSGVLTSANDAEPRGLGKLPGLRWLRGRRMNRKKRSESDAHE